MSFPRKRNEETSLFTDPAEESLDGERVFKSYDSTSEPIGGSMGRERRDFQQRFLFFWRQFAARTVVTILEGLRMARDQILKSFFNKKISPKDSNVEREVFFNDPERNVAFPSNHVNTGKYTLLNFLFKFLWEQFRKLFNLYFIMIVILQQIPGVSPTGRYTTIVPLTVVMFMAAVKEVVEDVRRHIADRKINRRQIDVWREGRKQTVAWQDLLAGDIVRINDRENFPADMVCLSSSENDSSCYIQTANLDGEINLKLRRSHVSTKAKTAEQLVKLNGFVKCDGPNAMLYEFSGVMDLQGHRTLPIYPENILLRGAQLKNTDYVYGFVVYTGHESKLLMNSHSTPLKRSTMDKTIDKLVVILFGVLIILSTLSAVADTIWTCQNFDRETHENRHFYLPAEERCISGAVLGYFILSICQFIILYNNFVPISLVVTVEIVKFIQAFWISQDLEMYDPVADIAAKARTSNLNEELGQVRYVFSDKTGTLTCNKMEFKKCCIHGVVYDGLDDEEATDDPELHSKLRQGMETSGSFLNSAERRFLEILAVCHSVIPDTTDKGTTYRSSSPDEEALVKAAQKYGFDFVQRTEDSVTVVVFGKQRKYKVLNLLEFSSERKRMSVIVLTPEGRLKLYIKGADSVILARLAANDPSRSSSSRVLKSFSEEGLRTLCMAEVDLEEDKFKHWREQYQEASLIVNRKEQKKQLDRLADEIERKLVLVGVAAIEDKLQDGVPEAIETLRRANINVWMLTGDKVETAINIAYSCKLLTPEMTVCMCTEEEMTSQAEASPFVSAVDARLQDLRDNHMKSNSALVVDGKALDTALDTHKKQKLFFQVARACRSVICCRMTPGQKADVVKVTKKFDKKATTLAIGDGANDVSMIQSADIGVGISGAEGLQATLASDFSITQFRFLVRLLLVHGVWNHKRLALVILYSFYKNIVLYLMEFWFAFFNMFSGQIIFERWTIGFYNVFFTFLPPVALGIADQDVEAEARLAAPERYKKTQGGYYFNVKMFVLWMAMAMFHSLALFALVEAGLFTDIVTAQGLTGGLWFHGNVLYTATLFVVSGKLVLVAHSWNPLLVVSVVISVVLWLLFLPIYGSLWPGIPVGAEMVGVPQTLYASGLFYAYMLLSSPAILFIDIMYTMYRSLSFSTWYRETNRLPFKIFPSSSNLACTVCYCYARLPLLVRTVLSFLSRCLPRLHWLHSAACACGGGPRPAVWTGAPRTSGQTDYDEITDWEYRELQTVKATAGTGATLNSNSNGNNEEEDLSVL